MSRRYGRLPTRRHVAADSNPLLPDNSKRKTSASTFFYKYVAWMIVIVALIIATVAFILVINKRLDDEEAREMVRVEQATLDDVIVKVQQSQLIEQKILFDKNISQQLLVGYNESKIAIANNTLEILAIDVQEELAANMTQLIQSIAADYDMQITALENALQNVLSVAMTNATTIKSGTCTLQGMTSTTVDYDYKKLIIDGLDYFYYVFGVTPTNITIDNTGFAIESCTNGGLYAGPNNGIFAPIYTTQLSKFGGDGASEITHLGAGDNRLEFRTNSFGGTRMLAITTALSHFVEFF